MLVPKVARLFNTVPSTNTALAKAVEAGARLPEGSVYLTRGQTEGRGQSLRSWYGTPGANLTFSILLMPDQLAPSNIFALNAFASLAVSTTLEELLPPRYTGRVSVKWPNDVYVGDRKIAGILIQNVLRGHRVQWSVLGLGLNINEDQFPPELHNSATSLKLLLGLDTPLDEVLTLLFKQLTYWYRLIETDRIQDLRTAYRDRLYRLGLLTPFRRTSDQSRMLATITGVSSQGLLQLRYADGSTELFNLQQLRFCAPTPEGAQAGQGAD